MPIARLERRDDGGNYVPVVDVYPGIFLPGIDQTLVNLIRLAVAAYDEGIEGFFHFSSNGQTYRLSRI